MNIIIIKPITAQLTRNTDFFKNMDPYVIFTIGNNSVKTSVASRAGKTPSWKDELSIKFTNEDTLKIEVWDKDMFKYDDLVGSTSMSLNSLKGKKSKVYDWIDLTYKGKDAGKILLDMDFGLVAAENIKKEKVNTNQSEPITTAPVPGIMALASVISQMWSSNDSNASNSKPAKMAASIYQDQSQIQEQSLFSIRNVAKPSSAFKPGQWPKDIPVECTKSIYVPQHQP